MEQLCLLGTANGARAAGGRADDLFRQLASHRTPRPHLPRDASLPLVGAISDKISVNRARGTATSAIWKDH